MGQCEETHKEVEKQIRTTIFQMYADYKCDSGKIPAELPIFSWLVRHAAWTLTRYAINADGQTALFRARTITKKVPKFSELVWFRIPAKQAKLAVQWREAHWVGKSEQV